MDFFAHQDRARRQTTIMVVLFVLSVLAIVASINLTGALIYIILFSVPFDSAGTALSAVPRSAYWITSAVVLGTIAWGTLTRLYELSGGGAAVAQMVGARWIRRDTANVAERRLLNVVEEMAIAAGITVPQVYLMEEAGINAFAAGYSPNEAAITVTRATIEQLDRDELQGVIAHEFSHILNGDMRLNIRMIGVIAGIVMIGGIGRFMMRGGSGSADSDPDTVTTSASDKRSHGDIRLFVVGLLIWLIGLIGVFFGNLIKAAISRQREFLADASAVQFTRNAEGIGGALVKIAQSSSTVEQRYSEELSHMFFCSAVDGLLATHPPIEQRIERVMGPGAAALLAAKMRRHQRADASGPIAPGHALPAGASAMAGGAALAATTKVDDPIPWADAKSPSWPLHAATVLASAGKVSAADVDMARNVLSALPPSVREATGTPTGARNALCALLLAGDATREAQLKRMAAAWGPHDAEQCAALANALAPLGARVRLPVFELCVPTLGPVPQAERDVLLAVVRDLAKADGRVTLTEFVLLTLCRRHFAAPARGAPPVKYRRLQDAAEPAALVLALVAKASRTEPAVVSRLLADLQLRAAPPATLAIAAVESALLELNMLAPMAKPSLIKACLELVLTDGRATIVEVELMRTLCAALDTPLPPSLGAHTASMQTEPLAA
jgi:Zn-dependent protease with chaperone function